MDSTLNLCLASSDWPGLEKRLQQSAESLLVNGMSQWLVDVLIEVPKSVRMEHPWINYWLGRAQLQIDLLAARPHLELSYREFHFRNDRAGEVASLGAVLDALWLEWDNCFALDPWLHELAQLRAHLQIESRDDLLMKISRSAFAGLSIRRPEDEQLAFWESLSLRALSRENYSADFLLRCLQLMIHYSWGTGDRAHSALVLETLHSKYGKSEADPVGSCVYFVVLAAHQHWFDDDMDACRRTVQQGLEVSEKHGLRHWEIPLLNCLLYKVCALQQSEDIQASLDLLGTRIQVDPRPHDQAIHYHFRAYSAWLQNHHDEALKFILQAYQIALDSGFAYSPIYYGVALVAIEFACGKVGNALALLGRLRRQASHQRSDVMYFMILMQGAAMAIRLGRRSACEAYLREAIPIAARQRYFSVPWLKRDELAELMLIALDLKLETGYVNRFISASQLAPPATIPQLTADWPWPHRVRILGKVDIVSQTDSQAAVAAKAPASLYRLLFHLVAAGPGGVSTEKLQEQLWPESEATQAYARLKTAVGRLRNLFNDRSAIVFAQQRVGLNPQRVWVDAWVLEQAADAVPLLDAQTMNDVLQNWDGLPDAGLIQDASLLYYPARLEDAFLQLISELTDRYEAMNDWNRALKYWRMAAAESPQEPVLAGMARCLKALGRENDGNSVQALINLPE